MANVIICGAFDLFHVGYLEMYGGRRQGAGDAGGRRRECAIRD